VASALDRVRRAPTIPAAMRTLPGLVDVTEQSVRDGVGARSLLAPILEAVDERSDTVAALAAVHALARVPGRDAGASLLDLVLDGAPGFGEHAAWALMGRRATPELVGPLAGMVAAGGLSGMHAQRVLVRWSDSMAAPVLVALEAALSESTSAAARRYLVETIGLVPGHGARSTLQRVATDSAEALEVRATAIAAFAERTAESLPVSVTRLGQTNEELDIAIDLVRSQRRLARRGPRRDRARSDGLRVAHIHLGESGGLTTLLPRLGRALADRERISEAITITRARPGERHPVAEPAHGHREEPIPLAAGEGGTFTSAWPSSVAAARGIRAALLAAPLPDVVHLRMADPGSLAGATVARELGIPTVFTLAPDPHGPMAIAEASGMLDRRSFARQDARDALWFRAALVERLALEARELVLFPRERLGEQLEELTGIDIHAGPPRHTVVSEGIDTVSMDAAAATIDSAAVMPPVIDDLQRAIRVLPDERHGLPLVVSVGRLEEPKGMARLVGAFARDRSLSEKANLVIVGGDLGHPSAAEAAELARIAALFARYPGLSERVILLGRRSNDEVALVLAAARAGWGALIGPDGAYACGSVKEEFGLAILEAMASGLPVVAPREGGPATYVDNGRTGALVDTTDAAALAAGAREALELSRLPETADMARNVIRRRFTLEHMARTLSAIYRISAAASTLGLPVEASMERAA
jgi:glycosyltransferase involved in cell wall biosynthesis